MQLKQPNLENRLHISTESPKEDFNDTVFQHFVDELKHCNSDMEWTYNYQFLSVFAFVLNIFGYVTFKMIFFCMFCFISCFISFPPEFAIF